MEAQIILIGIIVLIIIIIVVLVVKVWKNEKKKQKWVKEMVGPGTRCSYHFVSGTSPEDMWISKIRPDGKCEITFVGQERFMYPIKK
jgi:hypothetical protein